ncbi:hypothetical protein Hanom_Chr13g01210161 [Helianthus anomalus]
MSTFCAYKHFLTADLYLKGVRYGKSRNVDIPLFACILNMVVDCSLDMLQIWNMRRKCKMLSRN